MKTPRKVYVVLPGEDEKKPASKPIDRALIDETMRQYDKQQRELENFLKKPGATK
jgi:hypothetical protein